VARLALFSVLTLMLALFILSCAPLKSFEGAGSGPDLSKQQEQTIQGEGAEKAASGKEGGNEAKKKSGKKSRIKYRDLYECGC
jgi:hypothetical protein